MPTNTEIKLPHETATTDAQKGENKAEFIRQMVGIPKKSKEDKEKPDEQPKPEAAKPEGEKPPEKPVVKKKNAAAKPSPAAPALNAEDIAAAVTSGVREVLKKDEKPEPKRSDGLSDKEKKKLAVFEQMEKSNPANAGLASRFTESLKKHQEYQKAWEAKNPGKKFDIAEDDHADFVSANDLTWDQDEYIEALTDMKANVATGKVEEKLNGELSKVKNAERARAEAPLIAENQVESAKLFFKELGGDFSELKGAKGQLSNEAVEKLYAENPIYRKVVEPIERDVAAVSGELMKIARNHIELTADNPLHRKIVDYISKQEAEFDKLPDDQKVNQHGKIFTTSDKWEKMTKAQRDRHWVLTDRDFASLYAADASVVAKKLIEREEGDFKTVAEKRGFKPVAAAPLKEEKAPEPQPESRSPQARGVAPRMAPLQNNGKKPEKTAAQILFGR